MAMRPKVTPRAFSFFFFFFSVISSSSSIYKHAQQAIHS